MKPTGLLFHRILLRPAKLFVATLFYLFATAMLLQLITTVGLWEYDRVSEVVTPLNAVNNESLNNNGDILSLSDDNNRFNSTLLSLNVRLSEFIRKSSNSDTEVSKSNTSANLSVPAHEIANRTGTQRPVVIAIGLAITSRRVFRIRSTSNIFIHFQFFHTFLPTFCLTASVNFTYQFYIAYDHTDPILRDLKATDNFRRLFVSKIRQYCTEPRHIGASLRLVRCVHSGSPAWAQNDAMMEAYLDHVDYFYRLNDDTRFITSGWVEAFVGQLDSYEPRRVGVVGPNHYGGNTAVLCFDFVHRSHIDAFGFYYPRLFPDWLADSWITGVYSPHRSKKLDNMRIEHTMALGQRYVEHKENHFHLLDQIIEDQKTLSRYLDALRPSETLSTKNNVGHKVIAMSLFGTEPRYTMGVIRNAQLVPVHLPGWRLRVYVPAPTTPRWSVPQRVVNKLHLLGVDVVHVSRQQDNSGRDSLLLPPRMWRLLVADDLSVKYFIIRDADTRLNDRDSSAVTEWINEVERRRNSNGQTNAFPVHCIRDHHKHTIRFINEGLWGGRPQELRRRLGGSLTDIIARRNLSTEWTEDDVDNATSVLGESGNSVSNKTALEEVLWPIVMSDKSSVFCHDVVSSCHELNDGLRTSPTMTRRTFPTIRRNNEYVGQRFDQHQQMVKDDDDDQLMEEFECSDDL